MGFRVFSNPNHSVISVRGHTDVTEQKPAKGRDQELLQAFLLHHTQDKSCSRRHFAKYSLCSRPAALPHSSHRTGGARGSASHGDSGRARCPPRPGMELRDLCRDPLPPRCPRAAPPYLCEPWPRSQRAGRARGCPRRDRSPRGLHGPGPARPAAGGLCTGPGAAPRPPCGRSHPADPRSHPAYGCRAPRGAPRSRSLRGRLRAPAGVGPAPPPPLKEDPGACTGMWGQQLRVTAAEGDSGCDRGQRLCEGTAAGLRRLRPSGRCGTRAEGTEEPRALGRSRSERLMWQKTLIK